MQLTKHTDYAFRVLIYLASMRQQRTTIQAISETYSVSKTHLMKVVNELSKNGWVDSTRGKNGGICLGMDAANINLRDVFQLMERTLDPINCDQPPCFINGICQLKPILVQAQNDYLKHLGSYTLADIVNQEVVTRISFKAS